jgi:hypothetical protein
VSLQVLSESFTHKKALFVPFKTIFVQLHVGSPIHGFFEFDPTLLSVCAEEKISVLLF